MAKITARTAVFFGNRGAKQPQLAASFQVLRSIWPCLRHFSKRGAHSLLMNCAVISASIWCSSVIQWMFGQSFMISSCHRHWHSLSCCLAVSSSELNKRRRAVRFSSLITVESSRTGTTVPHLHPDLPRLQIVLRRAIAVFCHGDGKAAGQAKSFWHCLSSCDGRGKCPRLTSLEVCRIQRHHSICTGLDACQVQGCRGQLACHVITASCQLCLIERRVGCAVCQRVREALPIVPTSNQGRHDRTCA